MYPLYDQLLKKSESSDVEERIDDLAYMINSSDDSHINEVIASLILHHAIQNSEFKNKIPYSGVKYDKDGGIKYQMKDLPKILIRIIWFYMTI